jgi:hypothetical protein
VLAEVGCGTGYTETVFTTRCDGKEATTHLSLRSMEVDWECRVSCPAGSTTFRMTGSLLYRESIASQGRVASTGEKVETTSSRWRSRWASWRCGLRA